MFKYLSWIKKFSLEEYCFRRNNDLSKVGTFEVIDTHIAEINNAEVLVEEFQKIFNWSDIIWPVKNQRWSPIDMVR